MRAVVSGRVQGVGFRWSTRAEAEHLALTGFARNLADGTVIVEAQGAPDAVAALRDWLGHGPPSATVTGVDHTAIPVVDGDAGFSVV